LQPASATFVVEKEKAVAFFNPPEQALKILAVKALDFSALSERLPIYEVYCRDNAGAGKKKYESAWCGSRAEDHYRFLYLTRKVLELVTGNAMLGSCFPNDRLAHIYLAMRGPSLEGKLWCCAEMKKVAGAHFVAEMLG
jgi:hypothetical protein